MSWAWALLRRSHLTRQPQSFRHTAMRRRAQAGCYPLTRPVGAGSALRVLRQPGGHGIPHPQGTMIWVWAPHLRGSYITPGAQSFRHVATPGGAGDGRVGPSP